MPYSGKTTVGRMLSEMLDANFIDTDIAIEKNMGMSVQDIFLRYGETKFRELEKEIVCKFDGLNDTVIATGGGLPVYNFNMEKLNGFGMTVFLNTSIDEIIRRKKNDVKVRPLLRNDNDLREKLNVLYAKRSKIYLKSKFCVNTDGLTPMKICTQIAQNQLDINNICK